MSPKYDMNVNSVADMRREYNGMRSTSNLSDGGVVPRIHHRLYREHMELN